MKKQQHHGGDLDAISAQYGIPRDKIIDFAGNVNPLGFPARAAHALREHIDLVTTYPDREYTTLRQAIAQYTGADPDHILVDNGSTELISSFIRRSCRGKTIIIGPAYSEYEREVTLAGGEFSYFELREDENFALNHERLIEAVTPDVGLLILCNPNNPTGTAVFRPQLEEMLRHCRTTGTAVMVDETYMEFSQQSAEMCAIPLTRRYDNLFVIRGIAKFFAAPGLRLGYAVCGNEQMLSDIRAYQRPWSVNILASYAGEQLFSDTAFIRGTQQLIFEERNRIYQEISTWKHCRIYPSASNFLLVRLLDCKNDAHAIFEHLIRLGMLVRDAASFTFLDESYLRFCIRLPEQNDALLKELHFLIEE